MLNWDFYLFHFVKVTLISIFQKTFATAPLIFAAGGITCGVLCYWYVPIMVVILVFLFLGIVFSVFDISLKYQNLWYIFILPASLIFLGFFLSYRQDKQFQQLQDLFSKKEIFVRAVVSDIQKTKNPIFPYEIILVVDQYSLDRNEWISCSTHIKLMTKRYGAVTVGDLIELPIVISSVVQKSTSYYYFLMKEGIAGYFFIPIMRSVFLHKPAYSFLRFLYKKRTALYTKMEKVCSEKTMIFFKMLFLGKKDQYSDESRKVGNYFQYWGIVHMTARSGLHMTLFSSLCGLILQLFPLSFVLKNIFLLMIFFVYLLFSYSTLSFVRAFATTICLLLFHCFRKRTDFLHLTLLVYVVQLLFNPIVLFFIDFQLSFLLTIGIGFFFKKYFYKSLI